MTVQAAIRNDTASTTIVGANLDPSSLATDSKGQLFVTNNAASPLNTSSINVGTTSGGLSVHKKLAANTTNSTSVKGSAGQVYSIVISNMTAAAKFLKLYDKATAPTVGTDTILATFPVQANNTLVLEFTYGIPFALGIGYGMTGALADNDTTALAANDMVLTLGYK